LGRYEDDDDDGGGGGGCSKRVRSSLILAQE